ncbi:DoxX family protein [Salinicola endophyticus]|uniref:DoxX family membrane protein n=1 Tax=Salinicola endophyticus TaxID=1949083 RepID=A0AB74UIZ3_9GAMM
MQTEASRRAARSAMPWWRRVCLGFVLLWFTLGGIAHFLYADVMVTIIPPGLPWPRLAVWVSGVFELLGVVGLLLPRWRRLAGWGLVLLTLCVTPANVYMWLHSDAFPAVPGWLLLWRLPFQLWILFAIVVGSGLWPRRDRQA